MVSNLSEAMASLNPEQRLAVESIYGPVLVVAGPGTGKTQLLSLRVANILENCDISPDNILCLTYTEAGAEAMYKRLTGFIGKQAYQVRISTFHAFASFLQSRYTEYFDRSPFDTLITSLQTKKLVSRLLGELSISDPLYNKPDFKGVPSNLSEVIAFIGKFKRSGLKSDEIRAMIEQSLSTIEHLSRTELASKMCVEIPRKKEEKRAFVEYLDELKRESAAIFAGLPANLRQRVLRLPGSYEPLGSYMANIFANTELYEVDSLKTTGFQALRKLFFDTKTGGFASGFIRRYKAMASAIAVYERYDQELNSRGLYDFDDMILDATRAIEQNPPFLDMLQKQYQYILVDEFQDTNGSQMRIVELLTQGLPKPNILAVGDDDQAIMRFQGASVSFLNQFKDTYPGTLPVVLNINYRSTPSLVQLGQVVASQIAGRLDTGVVEKHLQAFRTEEEPAHFTVSSFASRELQYFEVARRIKARIDAGFIENAKNPAEAIAVIAYKHSSLTALIPYLKMFGVDFNYSHITTVEQIEPLASLLALVHYAAALAVGNTAQADPWLPQLLASEELELEADVFVRFALDAKAEALGWSAALHKSKEPELVRLKGWLDQCVRRAASASAPNALLYLAKPFIAYHKARAAVDPFALMELNYGLAALLDFVRAEAALSSRLKAPRPLDLGAVVALFDEAVRYGEKINVEMPISRPAAVNLTSAHSSKGLEYDLVYIIDTDENTWHGKKGKSDGLAAANIYLNEKPDDDDMRRLLFVAITRARYELELSHGRSGVVAELLDHVSEQTLSVSQEDALLASERIWQLDYYPEVPDLREAIHAVLAKKRLSASMLNAFVQYREGGGTDFVLDQAFRFPELPVAHFEFGTIAHRFLELYLSEVVKSASMTEPELRARIHDEIERLEFDTADISQMHERLDMIAQVFIPKADRYLCREALSEQWINADVEDVPLVGRSDLLLPDHATKTLWLCDYKTGSPKSQDSAYRRQLVFYKILLETSGDWAGWQVLGGMDIFIEPDAKTGELPEAKVEAVDAKDVEHVRTLIKLVHWRIQNADFDTSGFSAPNSDKAEIQSAFEQWLIDDYRRRA